MAARVRHLRLFALGALLSLVACLPTVHTTATPRGLGASVMTHRVGESTFIYLTVPKVGPEPGWRATFQGDTPPGLSTEDISDATILRWPVNDDSLKRRGSLEYRLTLRRAEQVYEVTVRAATPHRDSGGFILMDLAVRLLIHL